MRQPRRVKIAFIRPESILQVFLYRDTGFPFCRDPGSTNQLERLKLRGVPEGTQVVNGSYDFPRAAVALVLEHPSFDPVIVGDEPPRVEVDIDLIQCDGEGHYIRTLRRSDDPNVLDQVIEVAPTRIPPTYDPGPAVIARSDEGGWRDRPAQL